MNLLEVDSVIKSYGVRLILGDISLRCQTGEILGLLGRNGSGKSTLLKIIFGTIEAEKFIRIDGKVFKNPYKTPGQIAYLPQEGFLPAHLTIDKLLKLYLSDSAINDLKPNDILEKNKNNKVESLSGGELRYIEILFLLFSDCKFILLDEPFNGVSPILADEIKSLIKKASATKAIILTDHDYRNVLNIANRICILYDGGIKHVSGKNDLIKWGYLSTSAEGLI